MHEAYESIVGAFPHTRIYSYPDGQGGLWVELADVPLGAPYVQGHTFLVFLLPFTLPGSDVYPMFVRDDLTRLDGCAHGEGFASTHLIWPAEQAPRPVTQLSRRTRGGAFTSQTAAQKVAKVVAWLMSR